MRIGMSVDKNNNKTIILMLTKKEAHLLQEIAGESKAISLYESILDDNDEPKFKTEEIFLFLSGVYTALQEYTR